MKAFLPVVGCLAILFAVGCKESGLDGKESSSAAASQPSGAPGSAPGKPGELYPVLKGGKYGYIDRTGKMVIEPQFGKGSRFFDDRAIISDNKGKVGYIDRTGKIVIEAKYDGAGPFSEGLATIYIGPKAGVVNMNGEIVLEPQYSRVGRFKDGLAPAVIVREIRNIKAEDGGYIDSKGKFVIYPQFDPSLTVFSEGLAGVRKVGQTWSFIDKTGNTVIAPQWFMVGQFSEGLAGAMDKDSRWGFIDKSGKWAVTPKFPQVRFFSEGMAGVLTADSPKWGYIDPKGEMVIKPQFDGVDQFLDGIAMVQVGSKIGYIDKAGKYFWPLTE